MHHRSAMPVTELTGERLLSVRFFQSRILSWRKKPIAMSPLLMQHDRQRWQQRCYITDRQPNTDSQSPVALAENTTVSILTPKLQE